ncbi:cyclase [Microbacterium sp. Y-01]|uniref:cyclase family protein n=1 Tax=Microbacterium sp. Y-01 TaxID=2048898 RepID=UPI000F5EDDC6|nr:cyclase family protein [Microbacterium sp. Y-01]AZH79008.1 cyclase [Microbacterium sp. Y-01]
MKIIDLSIPIDNTTPADPLFQRVRIDYTGHEEGAHQLTAQFPGLHVEDLPEGLGWAVETVTLSTHNGTHVDAPWHYHPTMDGGRPAATVDELPLDWFFRPGVRLDFRDRPDGHIVTAAEIQEKLDRIGHRLRPYEIVLMNTAAGAAFGQDDYIHRGCGFGRDATLFLTGQGIRVVGTDAWSWDAPFRSTLRRYTETGDASIVWEGHKAGIEAGYCQIEKLHGLEQLPDTGFTVACFPARISRASAGWTRAVAIIDDNHKIGDSA